MKEFAAMTLTNKICIITGSASGIGLGVARRYLAAGAKVAIADLNAAAAEAGHKRVVTSLDRAAAKRAFEAMMTMGKIDHAAIEAAVRG